MNFHFTQGYSCLEELLFSWKQATFTIVELVYVVRMEQINIIMFAIWADSHGKSITF